MSIAVTAILALAAALVGPYFVDWTAYRTEIEGQASRLLGARVRVLGDADLRLLPTPTIVLDDVRLGSDADPAATAERVYAEIELAPLLRGEVDVTALEIGAPVLRLTLDADGRLGDLGVSASPAALDPGAVRLARVSITDGVIEIDDGHAGGPRRVTDIDMTLDARSLVGPFKAEGTAAIEGLETKFHVATGAADGSGSLKVTTELWPVQWPVAVTADGVVATLDDAPSYEGTLSAVRILPEPVEGAEPPADAPARGEGRFRLDARAFAMQDLAVSYGPPDRVVGLAGVLEIPFAPGAGFAAALSARQIELDRMAGAAPDAPPPPEEVLSRLAGALAASPSPPLPGRLTLDTPAVIVGGGVVQDVRLSAATRPDGWRIVALEAVLPGRTALSLSGDLATTAAPSFAGRVRMSSEQPGVLAGWWRHTAARSAAPGRLDLTADVRASAGGIDLSDLTVANDGRSLSGAFAWRPSDGGRGGVDLELAGERLDVDSLSTLTAMVAGASPAALVASVDGDLSLRLRASEVVVRGFTGRGLDLVAAHADGALSIERLRFDDLAGAAVDASGRIADLAGAPAGTLTAKIAAARLDGVAALVAELAPGSAFADGLARAAPSLAPADLTADVAVEPDGGRVSATLNVKGGAGGAQVGISGSFEGDVAAWRTGSFELAATASGVDGVRLLGQLGVPVLPISAGGDGRLSMTAAGRPDDGLDVAFDLEAGPSRLDVEGRVRLPETGPVESTLEAAISTPDATDVALALGRIVPLFDGGLPIELYARVDGLGTGLSIKGVTGAVAGVTVSGNGALDLSGRRPRLTGEFSLAEADLAKLTEFALGADAWTPVGGEGGPWSQRAFSPGIADGLDANLALAIDRLHVGPLPVDGVRGRLRMDGDGFRLSELSGAVAGGRLDAAVTIAQDAGSAVVGGRVGVTNADLSSLVWQSDGVPVATGTLNAVLELEGRGRSVAATVATLAGNGSFSIRGGTVAALDPAAFTATLAAADVGLKLDEASVKRVFEDNLGGGRLVFGDLSGSITVAGGVLRLPSLVVETPAADLRGTASADLAAATLDADWTVSVDPGERDLKGVFPAASIRFSGPIEAPVRTLDVTPLVAYLTLRESEREARRVEALQAEVLEHQRHGRELRRLREEFQRRQREADEAQRRAEAEAARRAEEEAALRRAEEERLELDRLVRESQERQRAIDADGVPIVPPRDGAAAPLQLVPQVQ